MGCVEEDRVGGTYAHASITDTPLNGYAYPVPTFLFRASGEDSVSPDAEHAKKTSAALLALSDCPHREPDMPRQPLPVFAART